MARTKKQKFYAVLKVALPDGTERPFEEYEDKVGLANSMAVRALNTYYECKGIPLVASLKGKS